MDGRLVAPAQRGGDNVARLRLLFAVLVILSHAFEIVDGNRSREPLSRLFGTLSSGELAVDGFFLLSGYLVTRSFAGSASTVSYVRRRLLRIVPGFWVCFWVCVLVVAPLAGAHGPGTIPTLTSQWVASLSLSPPEVPGVFAGLPYPSLNGPMWTIGYDVRCYALVPLVALAGRLLGLSLRRGRWFLAAAVAGGLVLNALQVRYGPIGGDWGLLGRPGPAVRLASLFGTGALFFLFRDEAVLTGRMTALAGAVLLGALGDPHLAEAGVAIAGGALLFRFAFQRRSPRPGCVAGSETAGWRRADLSYGLYLYAWPLQHLLIQADRTLQPWPLFGLTLAGAGALAWLSWHFVEAPCLAWGAASPAGGRSADIAAPSPLPSA